MKFFRYALTTCLLVWLHNTCFAQEKNDTIPSAIKGKEASGFRVADTLPKSVDTLHAQKSRKKSKGESGITDDPYKVDSSTRKKHDPRKATLYSTFCPGLGQIYNHKYWKLPLVYAAVGIPTYTYFYNRSWYKKCQYALSVIVSGTTNADSLARVDPKLQVFVTAGDDADVRTYRNEFRKDQDYSVIFFLLLWGLQIVDATVDAHLMNFDISNNLSLHIRDASDAPNLTGIFATPIGLGFSIDIHKTKHKLYPTK